MGSKSRIVKFIVPILQKYIDDNNFNTYIEPFVGGANVIKEIKCKYCIGSDINKYLIALLNNLDKVKTLPKDVTKEHYSQVRDCYNNNLDVFEDWYIGAIGFLASYNGRFFDGGYSGKVKIANGKIRDYYDEALRNLLQQIPHLQHINFNHYDYRQYSDVRNSLIYCDIPYKGVKQYNTSKNFNHDEFWEWVRKMNTQNNIIIVSELQAPDDFECIWQQPILRTVDNNKRVESVEKLFIHRNNY